MRAQQFLSECLPIIDRLACAVSCSCLHGLILQVEHYLSIDHEVRYSSLCISTNILELDPEMYYFMGVSLDNESLGNKLANIFYLCHFQKSPTFFLIVYLFGIYKM